VLTAGKWWDRETYTHMRKNVARGRGLSRGVNGEGGFVGVGRGVFPHPSSASAEVSPLPVVEGKTARPLPPPAEGKRSRQRTRDEGGSPASCRLWRKMGTTERAPPMVARRQERSSNGGREGTAAERRSPAVVSRRTGREHRAQRRADTQATLAALVRRRRCRSACAPHTTPLRRKTPISSRSSRLRVRHFFASRKNLEQICIFLTKKA